MANPCISKGLAMLAPVAHSPSGREATIHEWSAEGWGHPATLHRRIRDGRLPATRIDGRGTYLVREADLLAQPDLVRLRRRSRMGPVVASETVTNDVGLDDLAALAARMVATWPRLTAERRAELGRLLATP